MQFYSRDSQFKRMLKIIKSACPFVLCNNCYISGTKRGILQDTSLFENMEFKGKLEFRTLFIFTFYFPPVIREE